MSQAIEEPEQGEYSYSGRLGEGYIDPTHQKQTYGEKPAGTDPIWEHTADEFTDGIGHGLAAGYHTCKEGQTITMLCYSKILIVVSNACCDTAIFHRISKHWNKTKSCMGIDGEHHWVRIQ